MNSLYEILQKIVLSEIETSTPSLYYDGFREVSLNLKQLNYYFKNNLSKEDSISKEDLKQLNWFFKQKNISKEDLKQLSYKIRISDEYNGIYVLEFSFKDIILDLNKNSLLSDKEISIIQNKILIILLEEISSIKNNIHYIKYPNE